MDQTASTMHYGVMVRPATPCRITDVTKGVLLEKLRRRPTPVSSLRAGEMPQKLDSEKQSLEKFVKFKKARRSLALMN